MYTYICMHTNVHINTHTHTHMYVHINIRMYAERALPRRCCAGCQCQSQSLTVFLYEQIRTYTYIHTRMHIYIHILTHIYIYTHICTHTHMYIKMNIRMYATSIWIDCQYQFLTLYMYNEIYIHV